MGILFHHMFLSCVQRYYPMLSGAKGDIWGIVVHDEEFKVSQYADDTTSLVDEYSESILNIEC